MSTEVASFYQQPDWKPERITYSYANAWYSNKDAFRRKYYKGETPAYVAAFEYGNIISDMIKDDPGNPLLKDLPIARYPSVDDEYKTMLGDVEFVFHPDLFDPSTLSFAEVKTGMRTSSGKPSWDEKKVSRHKQLDCYSLGIESLFGTVEEKCRLFWLVKDKTQVEIIDGIMTDGPALFNGEVISFERVITADDRFNAKQWLVQAYHEISADYENYLKTI